MSAFAKILKGVVKFRHGPRGPAIKKFQEIKEHGHPTAVLFACMDARMTPLSFTQTEAGDMYIVRNGGNMVPPATHFGACGDEVLVATEPAALDLTLKRGGLKHAVVCGHSDCKAMSTLYKMHLHPKDFDEMSPLDHWIRKHGYVSLHKLDRRLKEGPTCRLDFAENSPIHSFKAVIDPENKLGVEDKLSQINTLQQMANITTHGFLAKILNEKQADLHAFWFQIETAEMHIFSQKQHRFVVINGNTVDELIDEVEHHTA
uniref:Carbonic anhydrase n=1 Tax=Parascaris univalens TaxID=6257 RepID=A0A915B0B3_PARUN